MTLADDCGTHVEIYQKAFDPTIYLDSRTGAPAELLDALDALGLTRCGAPQLGFWHQVPELYDPAAERRIASRAAAALTLAGWTVNIDPRLLINTEYDAVINEAAQAGQAQKTGDTPPPPGTTPRFRNTSYPNHDRSAVLMARNISESVDYLTELLVRSTPDTAALLLATAVAPETGVLARISELLDQAARKLSSQGNPAAGHRFELAAEAINAHIGNLHRPVPPPDRTSPHTAAPQPPAPTPPSQPRPDPSARRTGP